MKKNQNLPNKNFHSNNNFGYQIAQITREINHLIILSTEVDHQIKKFHEILHKIDIVEHTVEITIIEIIIHVQTQTDRIFRLIPVPIHILGVDTNQMIDQGTHHTIDIGIIPTIEQKLLKFSKSQNNNRSRDNSINRSNHQRSNFNNYQNRSQDNSQNRNSNYNKRQRNYSQSPHRNNTRYPDSRNKYRSNTPKHQRQINQVQKTDETNSELPGI